MSSVSQTGNCVKMHFFPPTLVSVMGRKVVFFRLKFTGMKLCCCCCCCSSRLVLLLTEPFYWLLQDNPGLQSAVSFSLISRHENAELAYRLFWNSIEKVLPLNTGGPLNINTCPSSNCYRIKKDRFQKNFAGTQASGGNNLDVAGKTFGSTAITMSSECHPSLPKVHHKIARVKVYLARWHDGDVVSQQKVPLKVKAGGCF